MSVIVRSVEVDAPPARVWEVLADFGGVARWNSNVSMSIRERMAPLPESVGDYPTPPSYEPVGSHVRVEADGVVLAETRQAVVVRQTGIPPVYYIPREDVRTEHLVATDRTSHCPYKGDAEYFALDVNARRIGNAAWSYPDPLPDAGSIAGHIAFYAHLVDAHVD